LLFCLGHILHWKIILTGHRTRLKHSRPKDDNLCPTVTVPSHTVTTNIEMIDIYCQSWLISCFLTAIDDIDMLINGLDLTLGAIYTPLMEGRQVYYSYSLKTFALHSCRLERRSTYRYKPFSTHKSWRGQSSDEINSDQGTIMSLHLSSISQISHSLLTLIPNV
jgi:hypothetical protein